MRLILVLRTGWRMEILTCMNPFPVADPALCSSCSIPLSRHPPFASTLPSTMGTSRTILRLLIPPHRPPSSRPSQAHPNQCSLPASSSVLLTPTTTPSSSSTFRLCTPPWAWTPAAGSTSRGCTTRTALRSWWVGGRGRGPARESTPQSNLQGAICLGLLLCLWAGGAGSCVGSTLCWQC